MTQECDSITHVHCSSGLLTCFMIYGKQFYKETGRLPNRYELYNHVSDKTYNRVWRSSQASKAIDRLNYWLREDAKELLRKKRNEEVLASIKGKVFTDWELSVDDDGDARATWNDNSDVLCPLERTSIFADSFDKLFHVMLLSERASKDNQVKVAA